MEEIDDQLIGFEDFCNVVASFIKPEEQTLIDQPMPDEGFNDLMQMVRRNIYLIIKNKIVSICFNIFYS